jgi:hypothetical protein
MIAFSSPVKPRPKRRKKVPDSLIYEVLDGQPIYRKGYKDVLNKTKKTEDIMGSSMLQWVIVSYIFQILVKGLDGTKFWFATGEPGLHIDRNSNLAGDILVYRKDDLPPGTFTVHYASTPALLHIEVDVTADVGEQDANEYLQKKVDKLMQFGTGKIIWVFTATKKVLEVTNSRQWQWYSWDEPVVLTGGVSFCIGDYLRAEGIVVE